MPKINSLDDLNRLKVERIMKRNQDAYQGITRVTVGVGTCGIAAGALEVFRALEQDVHALQLGDIALSQVGCMGLCQHEPIVEVTVGDSPKVSYGKVTPERVKRIIQEHLVQGNVVEEFVIDATPFPTI